jgi:LysR family hydrogen peroxide-inducible transcriptional activator
VVQEQNESRAAEKLHISQPSLSANIANLEKRLGCRLFIRLKHGLCLTDEGKIFFKRTEEIIHIKNALDEEMLNITDGLSGRIRLGISYSYSTFLLPKGLSEFRNLFPNVEITVNTQTSAVLERMLLDSELDVAIMVDNKHHPGINSKVLFYEPILLAVSPENPVTAQGISEEDDDYLFLPPKILQNQSFILSAETMRLRQSAEMFFKAEHINYKTAIVTASIETANRLAAFNVGIAFIPGTYVESLDVLPLPRYFTTSESLKAWTVNIAWRNQNNATPLIPHFVEVVVESV